MGKDAKRADERLELSDVLSGAGVVPAGVFPAAGRATPIEPAAATAVPAGGEAGGEAPGEKPARIDQHQCPQCGKWGCPRTGTANYPRAGFVKRWRRCNACGYAFTTRQVLLRDGENFGPEENG